MLKDTKTRIQRTTPGGVLITVHLKKRKQPSTITLVTSDLDSFEFFRSQARFTAHFKKTFS